MWAALSLSLLALGSVGAWADAEVYWRADTTRVSLGQPVQLELVMVYASGLKPDEPELASLLAPASYRPGQRIGPQSEGKTTRLSLAGQVRYFELGSQSIPALDIAFVKAGGDTVLASARPLDIEVVSVLEEGDEQLRDIKPPVALVGGIPLWMAVVAGVLVLALIGLLIWYLVRRYRRTGEPVEAAPEPIDHAAEFARIAAMGLLERGEYKTYYSLLADNLRRYMEGALVAEAMEKTTKEIEAALRQQGLANDLIRRAAGYLSTADLVKFARFHPELDSARRMPESGLAILRELEQLEQLRSAASATSDEEHAQPAL